MRKLEILMCLCMIFLISASVFSIQVRAASAPEKLEFAKGQVIVGLNGVSTESLQAIKSYGGTVVEEMSELNAFVVDVPAGKEQEFIGNAKNIPGVKYAELNGIVHATYTPNDPYWSYQWNMRIIKADQAWDIYKGSAGVAIGIIDTGIDYTHQDLAAHYKSGGYDWVNNDNNPLDDNGHGTHCAGIAAAVMDNGIGVVGVAQCSLWTEKVLDSTGYGSWDAIANGIVHATDNGVKVISMSLGGYGYSSVMDSACTYAWNHGVVLMAAAGNDNVDIGLNPFYPADYSTVIAVAATDSSDQKAYYSNYGSKVELSAPGSSIASTWPGNSYVYDSGTSMATPHVAGLAALLWGYNTTLTNAQLRSRLDAAVDDLGTPGRDIYYGYGRINAYKALTGSTPTPTLHWQYHFQLSPFTDQVWVNVTPQPGGNLLYGIVNLTVADPGYPASLLGWASGNNFYMAMDYKDAPGIYDQSLLIGTISTRTGKMYWTMNGTTWVGPTSVTLTPLATSTDKTSKSSAAYDATNDVSSQSWQYRFQLSPYADQVSVDVSSQSGGNLLYGIDNVTTPTTGYPASMLGWATGNNFYMSLDFKDSAGVIDMAFLVGTISTKTANVYETVDGTAWLGPLSVTLTPLSTSTNKEAKLLIGNAG